MTPKAIGGLKKMILLSVGWVALVLGIIGIILPLMPTTPFLLVAAYCFSRSSKRLYRWLLAQPLAGPIIRDWNDHGVISLPAKILSTVVMWGLMLYPLLFRELSTWIVCTVIVVGVAVSAFVWSHPSRHIAVQ